MPSKKLKKSSKRIVHRVQKSRSPFTVKMLLIVAGCLILVGMAFSWNPLGKMFQPASVNRIVVEDESSAKNATELKAIQAVNSAANKEARAKTQKQKEEATVAELKAGTALQIAQSNSNLTTAQVEAQATQKLIDQGHVTADNKLGDSSTAQSLKTSINKEVAAQSAAAAAAAAANNPAVTAGGGAGCPGNIPVGEGQTVASGRVYTDSNGTAHTDQRECVTCRNGKYVDRRSCADAYASDPTHTILPPDAGYEYVGGSKDAPKKAPKACLVSDASNAGNVPTGNSRKNDKGATEVCYDGKWVDKSAIPTTNNPFCTDPAKPDWIADQGKCGPHIKSGIELKAEIDAKTAAEKKVCDAKKLPFLGLGKGCGAATGKTCTQVGKGYGGCSENEVCTEVSNSTYLNGPSYTSKICKPVNEVVSASHSDSCTGNTAKVWNKATLRFDTSYCSTGCNSTNTGCNPNSYVDESACKKNLPITETCVSSVGGWKRQSIIGQPAVNGAQPLTNANTVKLSDPGSAWSETNPVILNPGEPCPYGSKQPVKASENSSSKGKIYCYPNTSFVPPAKDLGNPNNLKVANVNGQVGGTVSGGPSQCKFVGGEYTTGGNYLCPDVTGNVDKPSVTATVFTCDHGNSIKTVRFSNGKEEKSTAETCTPGVKECVSGHCKPIEGVKTPEAFHADTNYGAVATAGTYVSGQNKNQCKFKNPILISAGDKPENDLYQCTDASGKLPDLKSGERANYCDSNSSRDVAKGTIQDCGSLGCDPNTGTCRPPKVDNKPVITYSLAKGALPNGSECSIPGDCTSGFCANKGNVIFTKNTCEDPKSDAQLEGTISHDGKYLENMGCKESKQCATGLYCNKRFLLIPNVCKPLNNSKLLKSGDICYPSGSIDGDCDLCPSGKTWKQVSETSSDGNDHYFCD